MTPGGSLASSLKSSATRCMGIGVRSLGFTTTVSPRTTAYGKNQNGIITGKLKGHTMANTPRGSFVTKVSTPGETWSRIVPFERV